MLYNWWSLVCFCLDTYPNRPLSLQLWEVLNIGSARVPWRISYIDVVKRTVRALYGIPMTRIPFWSGWDREQLLRPPPRARAKPKSQPQPKPQPKPQPQPKHAAAPKAAGCALPPSLLQPQAGGAQQVEQDSGNEGAGGDDDRPEIS
jgi:hypothetical protein